MTSDILFLSLTAASIAFMHTLLGPDHYLPFVMMSKAGQWSKKKTIRIALWCGLGHVLSSVVLGSLGIAFGVALHQIAWFETLRGDIAVWTLIAFGILYMLWGLRRAYLNKPHTHFHKHADGTSHTHVHRHNKAEVEVKSEQRECHENKFAHAHVHERTTQSAISPWALFTVFVLGPCEPLIPLLFYSAVHNSLMGSIWIVSVFAVVTIATMMTIVLVMINGISRLPIQPIERYTHALAGGMIAITGIAVQVFQL